MTQVKTRRWAARAYFAIAAVAIFAIPYTPAIGFWERTILALIPMCAILLLYFPEKGREAAVFRAVFGMEDTPS